MGLFVVGRLASRHGIRVRLQTGSRGGLSALIWLPDTVAEGDAPASLGIPRRRFDADAYRAVSSTGGFPAQPAAVAASRWRTAGLQATGSGWPSSPPERPMPARQLLQSPPPAAAPPRPVVTPPPPVTTPLPSAGPPPPEQLPDPGASAAGQRLPIFDSVESDWFRRGGTPLSRDTTSSWTSPADDGFRAAGAAASPTTGETTIAGLPKRVPSANLVPGSVGAPARSAGPPAPASQAGPPAQPGYLPPGPQADSGLRGIGSPARTAEEVRSRMAGFQRGAREGRAAAPHYLTDES
jgi:hypothetical protein